MKPGFRQAIALEYGQNPSPIISAKGDDELAERILQEAEKHGVHVARDPQLLAMLSRLNVDEAIPPEMYATVAVLLSWVYWLKDMRPGDEKQAGQHTAE